MRKHKKLLSVVCLALVVCCLMGVLLMLTGDFGMGIALWILPMLAGGLLLYILRRQDERDADEHRQD